MSESLSEHVAENRRHWDAMADEWVAFGEQAWEQDARWGEWQIPNTELPLLADDMEGQRVIELGCGTGYVSAWMRRRGATAYAVDNSDAQLATARRLSERHGLTTSSGCMAMRRRSPSRTARSISRSASTARRSGVSPPPGLARRTVCCDPVRARVPRQSSSGDGVRTSRRFAAATERLERAYFDLGRLDWRDAIDEPGGIEFNLPISSWMGLFHHIGFESSTTSRSKHPSRRPAQGAR